MSGLDRHNKRNLSVFTLKNGESSIHHLLRVLGDLTTRGIWVRLLGKYFLIILHIGIVVWLVCLCLCFAFFFSSCDFYVSLSLCFSIINSQILTFIKMWTNQFVWVSFVFLWVLSIFSLTITLFRFFLIGQIKSFRDFHVGCNIIH